MSNTRKSCHDVTVSSDVHLTCPAHLWLLLQVATTVGEWCFALVFLAAGQRWLNRPGRLLAYSLGVIVAFYVLHLPVLVAVEGVAFDWIGVDPLSVQPLLLGVIVLVVEQ